MEQTEIIKNAIVRTLLENEIGSIEADGTRSMAGNIRRDQYHDMADKILKLVTLPNELLIKEFEQLKTELERDINTQKVCSEWGTIEGLKIAIARINIEIINLKAQK